MIHKPSSLLKVGAMLCAEGLAAQAILDDLTDPTSNAQLIAKITASDQFCYRAGAATLNLSAQPLSTRYIPQIRQFQSSYLNIANYLKDHQYAFEDESTGQAKTTLFFDGLNRLVAYGSIKCSSLRVQDASAALHVLPAIELVMLCVDDRFRRMGIGEAVLSYIVRTIYTMKNLAGIRLITLFSVRDAAAFYQRKFNFRELSSGMQVFLTPSYVNCIPMYLALPRTQVP